MRHRLTRVPADVRTAFCILILTALILLFLHNPTSLDDGLRHFAMALMMRTHGILHVPGWSAFLYEGTLSRTPIDPWFASDVLMVPFTFLPLVAGLHLFVFFAVVCLMVAAVLLLRAWRVPPPVASLFLVILFFADFQFIGRFLFARPYALMTAMLLFLLWSIVTRKRIVTVLMLALSVLLSQLFIFSLMLCCCYCVAFALRRDWRSCASLSFLVAMGVMLGLFLHPHPLSYIAYLATVFLRIPFLSGVGLSSEMQTGIMDLGCVSILVAWTWIILSLTSIKHRKRSWSFLRNVTDLCALLIAALLFTAMYVVWIRAIDVLWPLLVALMARLYMLDTGAPRRLASTLLSKHRRSKSFLRSSIMVLALLQLVSVPFGMFHRDAMQSLQPYAGIHRISPGSRVLNLDWDRFFIYVALRPDLRYATGIDPSFTYLTDPVVATSLLALRQKSTALADADKRDTIRTVMSAYPSDVIVFKKTSFPALAATLQHDPSFFPLDVAGAIALYYTPPLYR